MSSPYNRVKSTTLKETWITRCNSFIFVSTKDDPSLPAVNASVLVRGGTNFWESHFRWVLFIRSGILEKSWDWIMLDTCNPFSTKRCLLDKSKVVHGISNLSKIRLPEVLFGHHNLIPLRHPYWYVRDRVFSLPLTSIWKKVTWQAWVKITHSHDRNTRDDCGKHIHDSLFVIR